jgi:dihydroorotate dehydrogenase (NAD+) catalytic subunit
MAVDIDTGRPVLGNVTGGLSGPAIKPLAIRMVHEVYKKVNVPVIGIGGIMDYRDAVEFMLAGATAIQVGTANFVEPNAPALIVAGLKKYLAANRIKDVNEIIGGMKR